MDIKIRRWHNSKFFSTYYEEGNVKIETDNDDTINMFIDRADDIAKILDKEQEMIKKMADIIKYYLHEEEIIELFDLQNHETSTGNS